MSRYDVDLFPIVTVPQPWACGVLFGSVEVINTSARQRITQGWTYVRTARHPDRDALGDEQVMAMIVPYDAARYGWLSDWIIGAVRLTEMVPVDDCQLRFARGPWCVLFEKPMVFMEPIDGAEFDRMDDTARDVAIVMATASSKTPRDAIAELQRRAMENADPNLVHRPGRDGYTGD